MSSTTKNHSSLQGIPTVQLLRMPLAFVNLQVDFIRRQDPSKDPTKQEAWQFCW